jgi:hypothetical protein
MNQIQGRRKDPSWIDRYSGQRYRVGSVVEREDPEAMQLQTYRDVVREFRTRLEAKSIAANGMACTRKTVGLLQRRVVRDTYVAHVGKETNKFKEVEGGIEHDPDAIYTEYHLPDRDAWTAVVLPRLYLAKANELARLTGLSPRSIKAIRNGTQSPRRAVRARLSRVAKELGLLP